MTFGEPFNARQRVPAQRDELRQRDDRLECLLRLAGRLAHDFNNFLVPVLGYAALIREEAGNDSVVAQYAAAIEKSARKTESAIEDMLVAARTQRQFVPRCLDLSQLVAHELTNWETSLPAQAAITVHRKLSPCSLAVDEAQCRILLKHLLRNARLALATGGELRVELSPVTLASGQAAELGLTQSEVALLTVADSGMGMSPEVLQRAFDPFFTTRAGGKALGVGLSVAHAIVRAHGGQIVLESLEDRGTTARIWLPLIQTRERLENVELRKSVPESKRSGAAPKILLLISEPFLVEAIRGALQRIGRDCFSARDFSEAQKFFTNHPGGVAAVLVDVSVDEEKRLNELLQFRATNQETPFVFIHNDAQPIETRGPLSAGGQNFEIKKPFAMKGLLEMVAALPR